MSKTALEALKGSIAKWEAIVAGTGGNRGPYNCPLCLKYNRYMLDIRYAGAPDCNGCPVEAKTGKAACAGTPYEKYEQYEESGDTQMLNILAQAELDFLKSLLPDESNG